LFFSVTLFAINPTFTVLFFQNHCFIHPQAKKKSGTPTATTVPEMRQKKNNPKLRYITCSYMRFFILRTPLRFGENTLKKAYNQIMYNSRTRSTLCPLRCPKSLKISPPPISCAENKKHVVICLPCACSI